MTIEQRLAKLERQNKWMKRMGGLVLAAVACVVLMGQGKPKELPDLVAKSLTIKDKDGKTRIKLETEPTVGAPSLRLYDGAGKERGTLTVSALFSTLLFSNKAGEVRMALSVLAGLPTLFLKDEKGQVRLALKLYANGTPSLEFVNANDKLIWKAPPKKYPPPARGARTTGGWSDSVGLSGGTQEGDVFAALGPGVRILGSGLR